MHRCFASGWAFLIGPAIGSAMPIASNHCGEGGTCPLATMTNAPIGMKTTATMKKQQMTHGGERMGCHAGSLEENQCNMWGRGIMPCAYKCNLAYFL